MTKNKIKIIIKGRNFGRIQEYIIIKNVKLRKIKTCDNFYCKNGEEENIGIYKNTKRKIMLIGFNCIAYGTSCGTEKREIKFTSKIKKFCCMECLRENLRMRSKIFGNLNKTFEELK